MPKYALMTRRHFSQKIEKCRLFKFHPANSAGNYTNKNRNCYKRQGQYGFAQNIVTDWKFLWELFFQERTILLCLPHVHIHGISCLSNHASISRTQKAEASIPFFMPPILGDSRTYLLGRRNFFPCKQITKDHGNFFLPDIICGNFL